MAAQNSIFESVEKSTVSFLTNSGCKTSRVHTDKTLHKAESLPNISRLNIVSPITKRPVHRLPFSPGQILGFERVKAQSRQLPLKRNKKSFSIVKKYVI